MDAFSDVRHGGEYIPLGLRLAHTGNIGGVIDARNLPELPNLMIAGPGELHDEDLAVLGHQVIAHYGDTWTELHRQTLESLGTILGSGRLPYLIPGSGTTAMEMAIVNLFEPGQRVLIADTGFFGNRLKEIADAVGLETSILPVEVGAPIDAEKIADAADGHDGVLTVHVDTSTGVCHPIAEIAKAAHEAGAAYVVDGIASAGGDPVDVDGMGLDAFVTGSQKGLESPPGLGIVVLGKSGAKRIAERSAPPATWCLSIAVWDKFRDEWGAWHPHPVTMPTNLVLAMASSLKRILDVGIDRWTTDRRELARYCRQQLEGLGLKPVPQPGHEASLVVAVWTDRMKELQKHLLEKQIMVSGGLGPTHDKAIRVGLMGRGANKQMVDRLIAGISEVL